MIIVPFVYLDAADPMPAFPFTAHQPDRPRIQLYDGPFLIVKKPAQFVKKLALGVSPPGFFFEILPYVRGGSGRLPGKNLPVYGFNIEN